MTHSVPPRRPSDLGEHVAERIALAEAEVGAATPRGAEAGLVAAVAEVEGDGHVAFGDAGPDRVVQLVAERAARAVRTGDGSGPDVDDARAALEQRVDLRSEESRVGKERGGRVSYRGGAGQ